MEPEDHENSRELPNSSDRVLPDSERFASCPYDRTILEYYNGHFESVYVLLHPFLKPHSIALERFRPESWPSDEEVLEGTDTIAWSEVLAQTQFGDIRQIDVALRSRISGLVTEVAREDWSGALEEYTETNGIICPAEGEFSPSVLARLLKSIGRTGEMWLWVGDEFATERKLTWIDDIKGESIPPHGCLFTHDHNLLVTTHWDSHCSFLCSSRTTIEEILEHDNFEGFFCTEKTEVLWGLGEI